MENAFRISFSKCPRRIHLIGQLLTNQISHTFMSPRFLFRILKTAGLYLVPIKSYSKNNQVPSILKWIVVKCAFFFEIFEYLCEISFDRSENSITDRMLSALSTGSLQ